MNSTKVRKKVDFTGKNIYVGIDVHLRTWDVAIQYQQQHLRSFRQEANTEQLVNTLKRDYPNATILCAYESGFSGFWLQRLLKEAEVNCIVVNAADVPQTDKGRRVKTDRGDARRLAISLEAGQLTGIYIPNKQAEGTKKLVRCRQHLYRDFRRDKARIKHFLHMQGVAIPEEFPKSSWSIAFVNWLKDIEFEYPSTRLTLNYMIDKYEALNQQIKEITKQIYNLMKSEPYAELSRLLTSVPGVGKLTSATLIAEIVDVCRFPQFTKLNSFVGLCPGEHSSGDNERNTGIIPRHNQYLRSVLIETAWVAVRKDPALIEKFTELQKRMTKKRAIIIIARKLLNRIYHVWMKKEEYVLGIVE